MEKFGFVYLWFDKKRKRYYVGCHWGTEDDGYICSSTRMRKAYKKRPEDFKRRIISRIYTTRKDLFLEEHRYLSMIKDDELNTRYYNASKAHPNHWSMNPELAAKVKKKNTRSVPDDFVSYYKQKNPTKRQLSKRYKACVSVITRWIKECGLDYIPSNLPRDVPDDFEEWVKNNNPSNEDIQNQYNASRQAVVKWLEKFDHLTTKEPVNQPKLIPDDFEEWVRRERPTIQDIKSKYDIVRSTAKRWLSMCGLEKFVSSATRGVELEVPDDFEEWIKQSRPTLKEIKKKYNVSRTPIAKWFDKCNLTAEYSNSYKPIPDDFVDWYNQNKPAYKDIRKKYKTSQPIIDRWIRESKINYQPRGGINTKGLSIRSINNIIQ